MVVASLNLASIEDDWVGHDKHLTPVVDDRPPVKPLAVASLTIDLHGFQLTSRSPKVEEGCLLKDARSDEPALELRQEAAQEAEANYCDEETGDYREPNNPLAALRPLGVVQSNHLAGKAWVNLTYLLLPVNGAAASMSCGLCRADHDFSPRG